MYVRERYDKCLVSPNGDAIVAYTFVQPNRTRGPVHVEAGTSVGRGVGESVIRFLIFEDKSSS